MSDASIKGPGRVIGIGGVFFQSPGPERLRAWYGANLGIEHGAYGAQFLWRGEDRPEVGQRTIWSVFPAESTYFAPSDAGFMINYIVDDLDALLGKLGERGEKIDPKREDTDYGRFAWIVDPDGNKIELWEPSADKG